MTGAVPRRVPFDETFLDRSFDWLSDPELAELIMAPTLSRESQRAWWEGLPTRHDYAIWGIEYEGAPIGVMGLKDVGVEDGAEYFMYIGERSYWGRGIAAWAMNEIVEEVRARGLSQVFGVIGKHNTRSRAVHEKLGFRAIAEEETTVRFVYPVPEAHGRS
ncbi:MAG: hypothetical protein QOI82_1539 [Actinomycetota bacterium]|jgi:RimJ/RimL family protein N-acetyltransferase|nr:hypothetical protein [Actinomycetota bacterium]